MAAVKRGCVAAPQVAGRAVRASLTSLEYLRCAAEAVESIERQFAQVRPPTRFAAWHHESLPVREKQLALSRTALATLRSGAAPETVATLEAGNPRLLERASEIAGELGMPERVGELAGR